MVPISRQPNDREGKTQQNKTKKIYIYIGNEHYTHNATTPYVIIIILYWLTSRQFE